MGYENSAIIAIDWGTSSLRAWLLDSTGNVNNFYAGAHGISQVADKDFASVLNQLWLSLVLRRGMRRLSCVG